VKVIKPTKGYAAPAISVNAMLAQYAQSEFPPGVIKKVPAGAAGGVTDEYVSVNVCHAPPRALTGMLLPQLSTINAECRLKDNKNIMIINDIFLIFRPFILI
jgi:hypothetical protein